MLFLVSGEGPSDLGTCLAELDSCVGECFRPGPMAWIVAQLVEARVGFHPIESQSMYFVPEGALSRDSKRLPMRLPGPNSEFETGEFFKNARALARRAKALQGPSCPVCAVLFRDVDGTRSSQKGRFDAKWKSMLDGFKAENFEFGAPMLANPKGEAWLLCALKQQPYASCGGLEELSGNDKSPKSAKKILESRLQGLGKCFEDVVDLVSDGTVDAARIDMPSFSCFRARLDDILTKMRAF